MVEWFPGLLRVTPARPRRMVVGGLVLALAAALAIVFLILSTQASQARAASPPRGGLYGSQPRATLLCKFNDVPDEPLSPDYFQSLLTGSPNSLDAYWREVSYGAVDLAGSAAYGWFVLPKPAHAYLRKAGDLPQLRAMAQDCTAAAEGSTDLGRFSGLNLVFNECIERPRGGVVTLRLGGARRQISTTWLCPGWSSSHQIFAHEIGHTFGLPHSASPSENEYGNPWDALSSEPCCAFDPVFGVMAQQPIAYDKDLLGWIPSGHKFVASFKSTATVELQALGEATPLGGTYLLAEIPAPGRGGRFYTVEARRRVGFDRGLPAEGVVIHLVDPRRETMPAKLVLPPGDSERNASAGAWKPGMQFRAEGNRIMVHILEMTGHGFRVTISTNG